MKTLFLIRHAKSSWDNTALPDKDRPLGDRGRRDAPKMGKRLAKRDVTHWSARLRMALTWTGVHVPPRAVGMPRAAKARATPRSDVTPLAWTSRIAGQNVR
jgi:phosphohistidine phosphatase SixA